MAAYRDDLVALEERHRTLRRDLETARARSKALSEEAAGLHRALADVHLGLEAARRGRRQLPIAKTLIAAPCDVAWSTMTGDDRVRHCAACDKDVHNLSAMTRVEVETFLLRASEGGTLPCITLYQRSDGTMLTADCPVGISRRRRRALLATQLGLGAAALMAFSALFLYSLVEGERPDPVKPTPVLMNPIQPVTTTFQIQSEGPGYVQIDGVSGTKVYEGEQLRGTVPLSFPAAVGSHDFRFVSATNGESKTMSTIVSARQVSHLNVSFTPAYRQGWAAGAMPMPSGAGR